MSLGERVTRLSGVPGLTASVALLVVQHSIHGPVVVVSRRSRVNGHTGDTMSHAGQIVLLGGARDAGEDSVTTARREVCEEAGLGQGAMSHLGVGGWVGHWVTEAGFTVAGHQLLMPHWLLERARPDPREVAELILLPMGELLGTPARPEYHLVAARDRSPYLADVSWFESPTLRVRDVEGRRHMLWGLAGHMAADWRQHRGVGPF